MRREVAGEGGAGRDEVSELREDLRFSNDDLAVSPCAVAVVVVVVVIVVVVEVEHSSAAGGFWELESGVEGEAGVPAEPPFGVDSSLELTPGIAGGLSTTGVLPFGNFPFSVVDTWSSTVNLELGSDAGAANEATPLLLSVPLLVTSALPLPLPAVAVGSVSAVAAAALVDAANSWPVLLPTFILESVDLRFDAGDMRAYSCADGTGGGRNGDPGDGKGDEDDSLLTVTVSEGVSEGR